MNGWTRFNHHNCPVCAGVRNDCRQSQATNLIHCRHPQANPNDYIFRGEDTWGFGMWQHQQDAEDWTSEQAQERKQQWRLQNQARLAAEAARHQSSLSVCERDNQIRLILNQLTLKPDHRKELLQRGLTEEQIEQGMFRSVEQWQKLSSPVSHRLAGVSIDGRSLITQSGYLCPIWNLDQKIIGWQLRSDNSENGKYTWASSRTKKRSNGATSHLQNGELPITVILPQEEIKHIYLIEGILKPYIVWGLTSNCAVIGAAGGNFSASASQLPEILEKITAQYPNAKIELLPDAGAVANQQVYRRDCRTLELLENWGYQPLIADWGQLHNSEALDFDDYLASGNSAESITVITVSEYRQWLPLNEELRSRYSNQARQISEAEWFIRYGFKGLLKPIKKIFRGFGSTPQKRQIKPQTNNEPTFKKYKRGCIPWYKPGMKARRYECLPEDKADLYRELTFKGYASANQLFILDRSDAGTGKTHTVGLLNPNLFFPTKIKKTEEDRKPENQKRILYWNQSPNTPATSTIAHNYDILPSRNDNNCTHVLEHRFAQKARINEMLSSSSSGGADSNPICHLCEQHSECVESMFKYQSRIAYAASKISLSYLRTTKHNPENTVVVVEEASTARWTDTFEINPQSFTKWVVPLKNFAPDVYLTLQPWLDAIEARITSTIEQERFGDTLATAEKYFPPIPDELTINETLDQLQKFVDGQIGKIKRGYGSSSDRLSYFADTATNWLGETFRIIFGVSQGTLRITNKGLTVTQPNYEFINFLKQSRQTILLDATLTPERAAVYLGCEPSQIVEVRTVQPTYKNIEINLISGLSLNGKDRAESTSAKLNILKANCAAKVGGREHLGVIDFKDLADVIDTIHHFSGDRGSNDYQHKKGLLIPSLSRRNISALIDQYQALTGRQIENWKEDRGALWWLEDDTASQLIQKIARLRANRRGDEKLKVWVNAHSSFSDDAINQVVSYFAGATINQKEAVELDIRLGTRTQITFFKLLNAVHKLKRQGIDLTTTNIAEVVGNKRAAISKYAAKFGGFEQFKQLLLTLIGLSKRRVTPQPMTENLAQLGLDLEVALRIFLDLLVRKRINFAEFMDEWEAMGKTFGWRDFQLSLAYLSADFQSELLAMLFEHLGVDFVSPMFGVAIPPPE